MKRRAIPVLAALTLGLATLPAGDVAHAQFQPRPGFQQPQQPGFGQPGLGQPGFQQQPQQPGFQQQPGLGQQQPQQLQGAAALGNVVDQLFNNVSLLGVTNQQDLRQLLQARTQGPNPQVQVVILNDRLSPTEVNALRTLIQNSQVLRGAVSTVQQVVRTDPQLQQVLQRNNIQPNQVVAIDLLGQPLTLAVLRQPIAAQQPGIQQPGFQQQPQRPGLQQQPGFGQQQQPGFGQQQQPGFGQQQQPGMRPRG